MTLSRNSAIRLIYMCVVCQIIVNTIAFAQDYFVESSMPAAPDSAWHKYDNRAGEARKAGKYDDAIAADLAAIEIAKEFEQNNIWLAESVNNLGLNYLSLAEYKKADSLLSEAMNIRLLGLGASHALVSESYSNLGALSLHIGDYKQAVDRLEKAVHIMELQPETDPHAASAKYNNLAAAYKYSGRSLEAKEMYIRAITTLELTDKGVSAEQSSLLTNLGEMLLEEGKIDSADIMASRAVALTDESDSKPLISHAYGNLLLAKVRFKQERIKESKKLFQKSRVFFSRTVGKRHPDYALAVYNLGLISWLKESKPREAARMFEEAFTIQKQVNSSYHPSVVNVAQTLHFVYLALSDTTRSNRVYSDLIESVGTEYGVMSEKLAILLGRMAYGHIQMNDYTTAEPMQRRMMSIYEALGATNTETYAGALDNLGVMYLMTGRQEEALRLIEQALDLKERLYGQGDSRIYGSMENLTNLYAQAGDDAALERLYRRMLAIRKREYGAESVMLLYTLTRYGKLLERNNRQAEADSVQALIDTIDKKRENDKSGER